MFCRSTDPTTTDPAATIKALRRDARWLYAGIVALAVLNLAIVSGVVPLDDPILPEKPGSTTAVPPVVKGSTTAVPPAAEPYVPLPPGGNPSPGIPKGLPKLPDGGEDPPGIPPSLRSPRPKPDNHPLVGANGALSPGWVHTPTGYARTEEEAARHKIEMKLWRLEQKLQKKQKKGGK